MIQKMFIYTACAAMLLGAASVISSCSKDDDEWKGCNCTVTYYDGSKETQSIPVEEIKKEDESLNSCNDVAAYIRDSEEGDDYKAVSCSNL